MPDIDPVFMNQRRLMLKSMENEYSYVRSHFKELAQFIIPRRYSSLDEGKREKVSKERNKYILTGTGTRAARTLASGMLFGASSPARPWLKLTTRDRSVEAKAWVEETAKVMLEAMGSSNLYNVLGTCYLDLGVFGTSPMLIYEDPVTIFRAYSVPAGEYRLMKDERGEISFLARKLRMTADQMIHQFGRDNVSEQVIRSATSPQNDKFAEFNVFHLIEPNRAPQTLPPHFTFREFYWEDDNKGDTRLLALAGYYEKPFVAPRWEVVGNETYGVSPGMDALPDIIQLQHQTRKRAQSIDKMVSPPLVVDQALRNQPTALMPNGITYVPSSSQIGARAAYEIRPPLQDMVQSEQEVKIDIESTFYNDLFKAILQLRTVRSAAEVLERTEEKLVLLGPVVGRIENEALAGVVTRIFGIMARQELLPPVPEGYADTGVGIRYTSILSEAQRAIGVQSFERYISVATQVSQIAPEAAPVTNWNELLRDYAEGLSIPQRTLRTREAVQAINTRQAEEQRAAQEAALAQQTAQTAQSLAAAEGEV